MTGTRLVEFESTQRVQTQGGQTVPLRVMINPDQITAVYEHTIGESVHVHLIGHAMPTPLDVSYENFIAILRLNERARTRRESAPIGTTPVLGGAL